MHTQHEKNIYMRAPSLNCNSTTRNRTVKTIALTAAPLPINTHKHAIYSSAP